MSKVLLIEDEVALSNMYARILQQLGHATIEVQSGEKGVETAAAENPNLILLDYRLPDINGIEVLNKLKQEEITASIPVVVFSNFVNVEDKQIFIAKGAQKVLFKYEMTPSELIGEIHDLLTAGKDGTITQADG